MHTNYTFRKATGADIPAIADIFSDAKAYLRELGLDQWQGDYPSVKTAEEDVARQSTYILEDELGRVAVTITLFAGEDPLYRGAEGRWEVGGSYASIHRMAMAAFVRGKGLSSLLFSNCIEHARKLGVRSIRVDTHPKNHIMQSAILRAGFVHRGTIRVAVCTPTYTETYELPL